jgi:hypothetical protein
MNSTFTKNSKVCQPTDEQKTLQRRNVARNSPRNWRTGRQNMSCLVGGKGVGTSGKGEEVRKGV